MIINDILQDAVVHTVRCRNSGRNVRPRCILPLLSVLVTNAWETVGDEYDDCDRLSVIFYPDGTRVSYACDKNDNLTAVTDRNGKNWNHYRITPVECILYAKPLPEDIDNH